MLCGACSAFKCKPVVVLIFNEAEQLTFRLVFLASLVRQISENKLLLCLNSCAKSSVKFIENRDR